MPKLSQKVSNVQRHDRQPLLAYTSAWAGRLRSVAEPRRHIYSHSRLNINVISLTNGKGTSSQTIETSLAIMSSNLIPKRALLAPHPRSSSTSHTESKAQRMNNLTFDTTTERKSKAARVATKRTTIYMYLGLTVVAVQLTLTIRIQQKNSTRQRSFRHCWTQGSWSAGSWQQKQAIARLVEYSLV